MPNTVSLDSIRRDYRKARAVVADLTIAVGRRAGLQASTVAQRFRSLRPRENIFQFIAIVAEEADRLGLMDWLDQQMVDLRAAADGIRAEPLTKEMVFDDKEADTVEDLAYHRWRRERTRAAFKDWQVKHKKAVLYALRVERARAITGGVI